MPTTLGSPRRARSYVTPTGATNEVSRVLDFQLAANVGIRINWVLGYGICHDDSPTPSDTVPVATRGFQTLHLEEGATEDLPFAAGEDTDEIDTEIFFAQAFVNMAHVGSTVTFGAGQSHDGANLYIPYNPGVLTARNITHKGQTPATGVLGEYGVLIGYEYVRFTQAELGGILARR